MNECAHTLTQSHTHTHTHTHTHIHINIYIYWFVLLALWGPSMFLPVSLGSSLISSAKTEQLGDTLFYFENSSAASHCEQKETEVFGNVT